jgi:rhamnose transport system permease protein
LKNSRELRALILLAVVFIAAAIKSPRLLEPASINSILLWIPLLTVMAVGQMLVIVSRGIDVSIGSTLALSGLTVGFLLRGNPHLSLALATAVGLGIGIVLGFINGALIGWAKIPPIIATLGTLSAYRGVAFIVAMGGQVYRNDIPNDLTQWSIEGPIKLGAVTIPWLLVFALAIIAFAYVFTERSVKGRYIYAVGSNAEAAHMHGIPVSRMTVLAYTICGALAGLGGVLYLSRFGFLNPASAGSGLELTVIAATVIGGCDVRGGSGSVVGVLIGCTLLGTINVALSVVGVASDWQLLVYGAVILVALGMDGLLTRKATA